MHKQSSQGSKRTLGSNTSMPYILHWPLVNADHKVAMGQEHVPVLASSSSSSSSSSSKQAGAHMQHAVEPRQAELVVALVLPSHIRPPCNLLCARTGAFNLGSDASTR